MENLREMFILYLQTEKNYSKHTILNYDLDLTEFFVFLDKNKINNINKIDYKIMREYLSELYSNRYSTSTVSRKISTLKSFFKFLLKENIVRGNPMSLISSPKKEKKLPHFLYYKELEALLNAPYENNIYELRDKLILEMLYSTGIRIGELIEIKCNDVDLKENKIKIHGKGNKDRYVLFGDVLLNLLNKYLKDSRKVLLKDKTCPYLFINHHGTKLTDRFIRKSINKYLLRASVNMNVSPHTLRHTFATHMLNEGANIKTVQELLGHENISTTQIYTHVSNERLRNVYLNCHPRAKIK